MCSEKFRTDEDEQLIDLVHANPCLWNMSDPDFKKEKRYIWEDIGRELTFRPRTGAECKSRWRSIRDYYKKQKKDEKNGAHQVPAIKRRQVYWNSLKFLDDADDELKAFSNVQVEISEDAEQFNYIDCQNSRSEVCETAILINVPRKRRKLDTEEGKDDQDVHSQHDRITSENESCKQTEDTVELIPDLSECHSKADLQEIRERPTAQDQEMKSNFSEHDGSEDEIDLLFKAMAATVKKFSPTMKIESKAKIFSVINEMEMKHLELTIQSQYPCRNKGKF